MKTYWSILVFCLFSRSALAQVGDLLWEDNFNDGQLNTEYWNIETGTGVNGDFGTGQVDRATDRAKNISFQNNIEGADDGCLVITTQKEFYIDRNYTSGRINTAAKKSWGPGHRIVAKIYPRNVKHPGQGFAFWMMPDELPAGWDYIMWPQGGEIDIMEYVGAIPYHNLGSVHYAWFWQNNEWADWNHGHQGAYYSYETREVPNPKEPGYGNYPPPANDPNAGSAGFHEYGIDWYADRMEFFIDDHVYHIHYLNDGGAYSKDGEDQSAVQYIDGRRVNISEYSNHFSEWHPFEHKMYVILSAGVGGRDYSYGGAIVPEAEFPCSVYIDWVRVYQLDVNVGINQPEKTDKFEIYPNPVDDRLVVSLPGNEKGFKKLGIANMQGLEIQELLTEGSEQISIDVSAFAEGMYVVYEKGNKEATIKKFIVAKHE
ncbi:T9SS type A sorting domain-containing protein [Maribellus sediminis]|uniref:T9SS type A sorting domain-containing protein n=1 Tax=Maribellus sediminis TaxID=2696285 RepID=UPI0019822AB3|nr:T9SS type A sorting domain-containing protein [Maribellus sediminis]